TMRRRPKTAFRSAIDLARDSQAGKQAASHLKKIAERAQQEKIAPIETVRGTPEDPNLRESSLDAVLVADALHGFTHPDAMLAGFYRALRPGGRVAVLDRTARLGLKSSEYSEEHRFPPEMLISQAAAVGLRLLPISAGPRTIARTSPCSRNRISA